MDKLRKYWKMFTTSLYLSAFTFGGGYVIVPLMRKKFVEDLKWLEEKEMLDLTAIAQCSPGAIAINTSIIVGYKIGGVLGALINVFATALPPLIIISVISLFYEWFKSNAIISAMLVGMQSGVAAVICDAVITMGKTVTKEKDIINILLMPTVFILTYFLKINLLLIIGCCIALSLIRYFASRRKCKEDKK